MQELQEILERDPGPRVIIDIEFAAQFPTGSSGSATLLQLPQEIFIKNRKYILSGAIEYVWRQILKSDIIFHIATEYPDHGKFTTICANNGENLRHVQRK